MAELRSYTAEDIRRLAPMPEMVEALRSAFAARPSHLARQHHHAAGGEFLLMPAVDDGVAGIKLVMIQPRNAERGVPVIQGTYVLFDAAQGHPVALLDGAALTLLRTPAASAVATAALARADASTLGLIGAGPQGLGHFEAMLTVRPGLRHVVVASRTMASAERLAAQLHAPDVRVEVGDVAAAAACDVVCIATRATSPMLTASMIRPGTHINAVGAYRLDMRELSADLLAASTVTVDDLDAARAEAGDISLAVAEGGFAWDHIRGDLAAISSGQCARTDPAEITVFKSVGLAFEDLVVARLVAEKDGLLSPA